ncbi:MAG: hypothetical protein ACO3UU_08660, partial [Minisyncoccia bacterium]
DLRGNGNNGTLTNMDRTNFNSDNGGSLTFDGSNEYIALSQSITLDFNKTFIFYIQNVPSTGTYHLLNSVSIGAFNNRISITRTNLNFYDGDDGNNDLISTSFTGGSKANRFFAIVTDSSNLYTIEPDMTSFPTGSSLGGLVDGARSFDSIGYRSSDSGWNYFNGNINCFYYYNKSLSLQEIQQNFNALRSRYSI